MHEIFEIIGYKKFLGFAYKSEVVGVYHFDVDYVFEAITHQDYLCIIMQNYVETKDFKFFKFKLYNNSNSLYSLNCSVSGYNVTIHKPKRVSNWIGSIEYYNLLKYYLETNVLTPRTPRTPRTSLITAVQTNLHVLQDDRDLQIRELVVQYTAGSINQIELLDRLRMLRSELHFTDNELMNIVNTHQRRLLGQGNFTNAQSVGRSLRQTGTVSPDNIVTIDSNQIRFDGVDHHLFHQNQYQSTGIQGFATTLNFGELAHPQPQENSSETQEIVLNDEEILLDGFDDNVMNLLSCRHDGDRKACLQTALNRERILKKLPIMENQECIAEEFNDIIIKLRQPITNRQIKGCLLEAFSRQECLIRAEDEKKALEEIKQKLKGKTKTTFIGI